MGHRANEVQTQVGCRYRAVEVVLVEDGRPVAGAVPQVMVVDDDWETLHYVQENMGDFVSNLVRVKRMQDQSREVVEENALLFEKNLGPLFTLITATAKDHILDKFSGSLKKALLLMAMERFNCDSELICRALGLTRIKLERELKRCGLAQG